MAKYSYSALNCYAQCPEKYRLRYIEKLYPKARGSALFFGSAVDEAMSRMLLDLKKTKTEEDIEFEKKTPLEHFYFEMNKWKSNVYAEYYASDFDPNILTDSDNNEIVKYCMDNGYNNIDIFDFHDKCRKLLYKKKKLTKDDMKLYGFISWISLARKGELILKEYEKSIVPLIKEVFYIQKQVHLTNDSGDTMTGKIDFTCEFKDEPGKIYICDNKTSSKPYLEDSATNSEQLAIYCESEDNYNSCYVVLEKKIRKRDPKVRSNVIKGKISEENLNKTFDNIQEKVDNISENLFYKKDEKKECFFFGKKCEYYDYCWSNGKKMNGLIKKGKQNEKS